MINLLRSTEYVQAGVSFARSRALCQARSGHLPHPLLSVDLSNHVKRAGAGVQTGPLRVSRGIA
jgi:hypothetical protein